MHIDRRRDPHPLTFILIKKDVITLKSKNKTQSKNVSLINKDFLKEGTSSPGSPIFFFFNIGDLIILKINIKIESVSLYKIYLILSPLLLFLNPRPKAQSPLYW